MNCSQIFCTFAVETTSSLCGVPGMLLWIALKFFVLLQSKQPVGLMLLSTFVVNCSQIFCTFAVETTGEEYYLYHGRLWIALKFFVLLQSKQRTGLGDNSQCSCELLSNFLYFCSRNNKVSNNEQTRIVVNCSQIFCTFAVETTWDSAEHICELLWIALKFFVLLQSKQHLRHSNGGGICCELLSNFLYFCSRNNTTQY